MVLKVNVSWALVQFSFTISLKTKPVKSSQIWAKARKETSPIHGLKPVAIQLKPVAIQLKPIEWLILPGDFYSLMNF